MLRSRWLRKDLGFLKRLLWTVESKDNEFVLRGNENNLRYPFVWLRDNCLCPLCFHKASNSRTINLQNFNFDSKPSKAYVSGGHLEVSWSDSHYSRYALRWLLDHQFTGKGQTEWLAKCYQPTPRPWTAANFSNILRRYQFQDILCKDEVLLQWLESLAVDGVAMVEAAEARVGQLRKLAERIAFLRRTNYGNTFTVANKQGTSNFAYLSGALQLHTDLPYFQYKPGVNMLHCITQDEGSEESGCNEIVDGLSCCNWLRENHPHCYWILSTIPVVWEDIVEEDGEPYHMLYRAPVICEDVDGSVWRVNWSQPQRGSHFTVPVDQVTLWYRAMQVMANKVNSPDSKVSFKMKPGEILTFNNVRLLHGRTSFEGDRHLEGGYLDWDLIYSKIRVLRRQLKLSGQPETFDLEECHLQGPFE